MFFAGCINIREFVMVTRFFDTNDMAAEVVCKYGADINIDNGSVPGSR
jgi:hypothetical protein